MASPCQSLPDPPVTTLHAHVLLPAPGSKLALISPTQREKGEACRDEETFSTENKRFFRGKILNRQ